MKTIICVNGPLPNENIFRFLIDQADMLICADGGANRVVEKDVIPNFVVGDLDSISAEARSKIPSENLIHQPSQYATDFEKTLQFAIDKQIENAIIIGATGERLDHQICNLTMIEKFSPFIDLQVVDDWGIGQFISEKAVFNGEIGQHVSLHSFGKAEGITTSGLKYPLKKETLEWAVRDGQSNEIISNPVEISVQSGALFMFRVFGNDPIAMLARSFSA